MSAKKPSRKSRKKVQSRRDRAAAVRAERTPAAEPSAPDLDITITDNTAPQAEAAEDAGPKPEPAATAQPAQADGEVTPGTATAPEPEPAAPPEPELVALPEPETAQDDRANAPQPANAAPKWGMALAVLLVLAAALAGGMALLGGQDDKQRTSGSDSIQTIESALSGGDGQPLSSGCPAGTAAQQLGPQTASMQLQNVPAEDLQTMPQSGQDAQAGTQALQPAGCF